MMATLVASDVQEDAINLELLHFSHFTADLIAGGAMPVFPTRFWARLSSAEWNTFHFTRVPSYKHNASMSSSLLRHFSKHFFLQSNSPRDSCHKYLTHLLHIVYPWFGNSTPIWFICKHDFWDVLVFSQFYLGASSYYFKTKCLYPGKPETKNPEKTESPKFYETKGKKRR